LDASWEEISYSQSHVWPNETTAKIPKIFASLLGPWGLEALEHLILLTTMAKNIRMRRKYELNMLRAIARERSMV
jgi:hypothetical protein